MRVPSSASGPSSRDLRVGPFRLTAVITTYAPPDRFVNEQRAGPFASWRHEHTFVSLDGGVTLMTDTVRYRAPFGLFGTVAERLVLSRYLPRLLRQRNEWLKATLEL